MSVIDVSLRFSQCRAVLTHDEILAELRKQVAAKAFTQKALADHLRVAPPRIKEMLKGERRIQPEEMPVLARYLGMVGAVEPEPAARQISLPVILPSAAALTEMFAALLEIIKVDPDEGERAKKLALSFPGAFQAASLARAENHDLRQKIREGLPRAAAEDRPSP